MFQNIQVGSDYQAVVPQGLSTYGEEPGRHFIVIIFVCVCVCVCVC